MILYTLGEEKERLMARQKSTKPTPLAKSEDAALDRLRSDLIDSSDEEDARNPMEQASPQYVHTCVINSLYLVLLLRYLDYTQLSLFGQILIQFLSF